MLSDSKGDGPSNLGAILGVISDCADARDWEWGTENLRRYGFRADPKDVVLLPEHANSLAWAAAIAPYAFVEELRLLLENDCGNRFEGADAFTLPSLISDHLFAAALRQVETALRLDAWLTAGSLLELLVNLPGASAKRTDILLDVSGQVAECCRALEDEILVRGHGHRVRLSQLEREQVRAAQALAIAACQSTGYAHLTPAFVRHLLTGAKWPLLGAIDQQTVAMLWPELEHLHGSEGVKKIGDAARQWLRQVIEAHPEDQEFAAGELDEP